MIIALLNQIPIKDDDDNDDNIESGKGNSLDRLSVRDE